VAATSHLYGQKPHLASFQYQFSINDEQVLAVAGIIGQQLIRCYGSQTDEQLHNWSWECKNILLYFNPASV
jgi:hypothetical protein